MRRRLTVTVVGLVAASLVVAGLGTLVLGRAAARNETRGDLENQAVALSALTDGLQQRPVLAALRRSLRLEGAAIVLVPSVPGRGAGPGLPGPASTASEAVGGVTLAEPDLELLRAGAPVVSGWRGNVAYAAAPVVRGRGPVRLAVLLTRKQATGLGTAVPWFIVSAGAALLVAVAVADRLARRFARPLSAAGEAARRIAAGDLAVRVDPGRAESELVRLAASINTMAADLERARGLQRQFLLSVSHELRTPLTSVRGFAEAIADGAAPDTRRAAEVIGAEARRLERLVGDLLDLAKLDARSFALHIEMVDVSEVVVDTAEGFRHAATAAGLTLAVTAGGGGGRGDAVGAGGPLVAAADRERLAQVVANLLENALKFAASRIEVSAAHQGGRVALSVADDGPGMADEDLPHVFGRLFQSGRQPARQAGSGLGLAIVAELSTAMGARVEALSVPGGGTRMVVHLPAAPVIQARPSPT